jgi:hypothetical protein
MPKMACVKAKARTHFIFANLVYLTPIFSSIAF